MTRTIEEEFDFVCKSAGLVKLGISKKPTYLTVDKSEGVELDGTAVRVFNNDAGERNYKDVPGSTLQAIVDAFKAPAPEVKHEKEYQEAEKGKDAKVEEHKASTPERKGEVKELLDLIKSYTGNDVLEVFGDSGTGKSKFVLELARQLLSSGKTVFYLDTERNLTDKDVAMLKGCQYKYTPVIAEIGQISRQLPKVDVVIIDSIGFPVLTAYARMSMKQKGDALLNLIAIFGDLKEWAYRNNGVAVVINQPESDFNKEPGHLIRPFGDKSQFAAKEIWKTEILQRGKVTKIAINAFRSRSLGHGTKIATMEISENGVKIEDVKS